MSDKPYQDDKFFELLAQETDEAEMRSAPSRLKAKLLSALVRKQEASGPLRSLAQTRAQGYELCVFEDLWQRTTSAEAAQCFNCCRLCHARVLAERVERAPLYWAHCPYAAFAKK
jgi:hypothetical protein